VLGLRLSAAFCALVGGVMVASNTSVSPYGFLVLCLSSGQLCLVAWWIRDRLLLLHSGVMLVFVDGLGVWRWLL